MASKEKQSAPAAASPLVVSYDELLRKDPEVLAAVEKAYGPGGLGVIAVSGVPGLAEARSRLLPLARGIARLPAEKRKELEDPPSRFNFGWSHGKEALSGGRPDVAKGSFYANPLLPEGKESPLDDDDEGTGDDEETSKARAKAAALARFPGVCRRNVWPSDGVLPELRPAFREAGRILADAAVAVAGACDAMIESKAKEVKGKTDVLRSLIESGDAAKGRLLYYYPRGRERTDSLDGVGGGGEGGPKRDGDGGDGRTDDGGDGREREREEADGWCGIHTDHSVLTALTRAMYLDDDTGEEVGCPDPSAGLWVRPRRGWRGRRTASGDGGVADGGEERGGERDEAPFVRVLIPPDVVAVQAGEAAQVVSGGLIVATPHCVRAAESSKSVARATFALFMQPRWDAPLEPVCFDDDDDEGGEENGDGADGKNDGDGGRKRATPESIGVARWRPGDTFGDFSERTFDAYYR